MKPPLDSIGIILGVVKRVTQITRRSWRKLERPIERKLCIPGRFFLQQAARPRFCSWTDGNPTSTLQSRTSGRLGTCVQRAVADLRILWSCLNASTFKVSSYSDVMGPEGSPSLMFLLLWCLLRTESHFFWRCAQSVGPWALKASLQVLFVGYISRLGHLLQVHHAAHMSPFLLCEPTKGC